MNNTNTIIIFLACVLSILVFGKMFILPIKLIIKLMINSLLGGLIITAINWIGVAFNLHIGLNLFTSIFVRDIRNSRYNFISDI